jgi:hypothetical protein
MLARLEAQPDQQLFGVAAARTRLHALLQTATPPWIVAIDGLGGIGKTTLATSLAHEFVYSDRFADLAWVSAKQEEFQPGAGTQATGRPALDIDGLTDALLGQLLPQTRLTAPRAEKHAALLRHLKTQPCLVVVDNLETVVDYSALLPDLRQLANPSKFLISTRFSLRAEADVFAYTLTGLSESDALALVRYEAETRNIAPLLTASPEQLTDIHRVVGGNPLALKLVMGQAAFLPLAQVLTNLELARGKRVEALYNYIYWQAWQLLTPNERHLFLTLPLAPNGDFEQVALASGLEEEALQGALARLIELSLLHVAGDLSAPRYSLHRLTETFLMHEVLKWQSAA